MPSESGLPRPVPIAIVGLTAIMPGATDVAAFWRNVVSGRDLLTEVPATRWSLEDFYDPDPRAVDKTYCRRGAFLPEVEFDPMRFGISPNKLAATDTAQLLAVLAADRVLASLEGVAGERVSVFLGAAASQLLGEMAGRMGRPVWEKVLRDNGIGDEQAARVCEEILGHAAPWQEATFPGMLTNVIAGRVANRFDFHGANFTVDAACASSLAALSVAADELALGRADLVLTGGVDTLNNPMTFIAFSKTPALSPTGDCRPFSDQADGMMLGEGLALFALKRLADAEAGGDAIHAVITGIGSSSDGAGTSIYAPARSGQERALRRAYAAAGYGPETVELVEAHGTATQTGDAAEIAALRTVFADQTRARWCALGSVKSQIGHAKAAAGAAGLLKAVLALRHRVLPPTIKVDRPHPELAVDDSPFYVNTATRPWLRDDRHPRRASVSSFGFGGTNFHVTLEEYRPRHRGRMAPACTSRPTELVLASADSPDTLIARCRELAASTGSLPLLAQRAQHEFDARSTCRLGLVAADSGDLAAKLDQAAQQITARPGGFHTPAGAHYANGPRQAGRIGFLFPGQGSQYVGMGADLAVHFPHAHEVWSESAAALPGLAERVFPIPVFTEEDRARQRDRLRATEWAQPAIAAASVALLTVLDSAGIRPDGVAGHSFGELTALHAARAIDASTLLRLARRRGELFRDVPAGPGGMLAVEAVPEEIADQLAGRQVWIANHNTPRQLVLSGTADALSEVEKLLPPTAGARRLGTSAAFHCPLVAPVAEPLAEYLATQPVRSPLLDVYSNTHATRHPLAPDDIRHSIADQVAAPVRFADMISAMYADGVRTFVEVGPGRVLTGLVRQTLDGREHHAIATDHPNRDGVTALHEALAQLAVLGVPMSFGGLWQGADLPRARDAGEHGRMPIMIGGANHGSRYPAPAGPTPPAVPPPASSPPAPVLPPAPAPMPDPGGGTAVEALLEVQRQTSQAHSAYLAMAAQSVHAIGAMTDPATARARAPEPAPPHPAHTPTAPPVEPDLPGGPGPHADPPTGELVTTDLEATLLSAVSDTTGYPLEVLSPDMELEADLGLDSITRAQVFATVRPMLPGLEAIGRTALSELATLRTVGEIAIRLRAVIGTGPPVTTVVSTRPRRQILELVPARPDGKAATPPEGTLAILRDSSGIAENLAHQLTARGVPAVVHDTAPPDAGGVVFLGGLAPVRTPEQAWEIHTAAFHTARTVAPRMTAAGGLFVTVQDTGGFGLRHCDPLRSWLGGLAALPRTARWEWPKATTRAIDCRTEGRSNSEIATMIADELLRIDHNRDVYLDGDGNRWTPAIIEAEPAEPAFLPLDHDPVLLVTGGGRGITAAAVIALAQHQPAGFVLCGSSADPPQDTISTLEATGSRVRYLAVDARDRERLHDELAGVRSDWGPVTGLVHGAGVLADGRIEHKTDEQFHQVFSTKTAGLRAVLAETRDDPLRLVVVFSSVSGTVGNPGQSDYAMANETLNHVLAAERARRPDAIVRSMIWGPWHGGMVTPAIQETLAMAGVRTMSIEEGVRSFLAELGTTATDPRVILSADSLGEAETR
ncbi:type I polyketide synthase [Amycolatopsis minnesotensis]|uniref:Ketosynthase family 3 (KS3) domain-containing protein n=1 Tax=Amycolatopsis minnesotensis TaxID=337894 RepID=A0ABN2QR47_9PSEU